MQKKIIALAVAGLMSGAAFAQSNVTISGGIYMGYDMNKTSGSAGTAGFGSVNRITDHSSNINFNGSEDLGGGMKAVFQIDSRFGADQAGVVGAAGTAVGSTWSSGNTHVGLTGNWGGIRMGKQDFHYNELAGGLGHMRVRSLQSLLGHGIMSEVNGVGISPRNRAQNAVWYTSPSMSGLTAQLAYMTNAFAAEGGQAADGSKGGAQNLVVRYANGPINAGYSYWKNNEEGGNGVTASTATSDQRSDRLWARYAFPMGLSIGLGWDSSKYDSDVTANTNMVKRTAWQLTGQYTMGANQFYLQYAKAGNTSGAGAADNSSGAKAWLLGYDYALSKRTAIGISYTQLKNDSTNGTYDFFASPVGLAAAAANNGYKSTQWHLGMSHAF